MLQKLNKWMSRETKVKLSIKKKNKISNQKKMLMTALKRNVSFKSQPPPIHPGETSFEDSVFGRNDNSMFTKSANTAPSLRQFLS
ncbi:hypothetical protein GCK72_023570 [Caenorhabditis remanei]|uniref:Uncharacterized protein n=1 Tax=Caenorhabditis remanei TaxID=31234 RepID=A0A6A5FXB7_CAERE|nr:hypothetical protein GCK72_023570 [Caenorhabditis remanei]KAF1747111.1 hypothetical protein GCK72_023570 [Caenorhabditis remanei]